MGLLFRGGSASLRKILLLPKRQQHGVPEVGENVPERKILFGSNGLPDFNNVTAENCRAFIGKQTIDFEMGVEAIDKKLIEKPCENIFKEVFQPLEELGMPLDITWGLSKTLYLGSSSLMPTSSYMLIHDRARRARASKFSSKEIYKTVKLELENVKEKSPEENRLLHKFAIEGKLNGLDLESDKQAILTHYLNTLVKEREALKQKVEIATKQFKHIVTDMNVVREFPKGLLKKISSNPNYSLDGPWKITLNSDVYKPVMEHCPDRQIRWNLWQAQVSRGSNYRDRELATSLNIEEIRYTRRNIANLLGYQSYAEMSMETKMAKSVAEVQSMLDLLLENAKPAEEEEVTSLYQFAVDRGLKSDNLELWDIPYWRRKQRKTVYDYEEDKFKEYFPLSKVTSGLIQLCERLFNIVIKQRSNVSVWHKDVKFYDIFEANSDVPLAGLYADLHSRPEDKLILQNNGWMVGIQNRSYITSTKPLAALIFNFESSPGQQEPYLTFDEVKSLFSKFGHAMQHLLTRTNYSEVAGLSNIEWDAVEICGHVLSHWLYRKSTLDSISCHCSTGDTLPEEKFQTLLNIRKHMAGLDLCRELYLSALDLELYSSKDFWLDIMKSLWPKYRSFTLHKIDSHPCSFTQVFVDEWGAAYYSHVWAELIGADVYSAFHEAQEDEQQIREVGKRFKDTFLSLGGSVHPSQIFREFRGRDPSPKALLNSLGLKKVRKTNEKV